MVESNKSYVYASLSKKEVDTISTIIESFNNLLPKTISDPGKNRYAFIAEDSEYLVLKSSEGLNIYQCENNEEGELFINKLVLGKGVIKVVRFDRFEKEVFNLNNVKASLIIADRILSEFTEAVNSSKA